MAMSTIDESPRIDFFVSYTGKDVGWAEWIAWQLEQAGYRVLIQAWDFQPGANFVAEMERAMEQAAKTVAVLSPDYLTSTFSRPEWQACFREDPDGTARRLLPVRVGECTPSGLLGTIVYVNLVGVDEVDARARLLAGADNRRAMPSTPPVYPGHLPPPRDKPEFPPDHRSATSDPSPQPLGAIDRYGLRAAMVAVVLALGLLVAISVVVGGDSPAA
jgi:hypothetical protein